MYCIYYRCVGNPLKVANTSVDVTSRRMQNLVSKKLTLVGCSLSFSFNLFAHFLHLIRWIHLQFANIDVCPKKLKKKKKSFKYGYNSKSAAKCSVGGNKCCTKCQMRKKRHALPSYHKFKEFTNISS